MPETKPGHPHGAMRRKDREIVDRSEIDAIVQSSHLMHLALADDGVPYVVPLFYWYDGAALYFHSAQAGSKIEILKRNNLVCFEITVDHGIIVDESPCDFEAKHRTVIGLGRASFIEDETQKIRALNGIVANFSDKHFEFPAANLNRTAVIRIAIQSIKGKKHGFAKQHPHV